MKGCTAVLKFICEQPHVQLSNSTPTHPNCLLRSQPAFVVPRTSEGYWANWSSCHPAAGAEQQPLGRRERWTPSQALVHLCFNKACGLGYVTTSSTKSRRCLRCVLFGFGCEGVCSVLYAQLLVPQVWQCFLGGLADLDFSVCVLAGALLMF